MAKKEKNNVSDKLKTAQRENRMLKRQVNDLMEENASLIIEQAITRRTNIRMVETFIERQQDVSAINIGEHQEPERVYTFALNLIIPNYTVTLLPIPQFT